MERSGFAIWRDSVSFGLSIARWAYWAIPLLCIPILGDVMSSILVREDMKTANRLKSAEILAESLSKSIRLFMVKLYFGIRGLLWAFIPIYGYIKALRHRQYWAMASNVLIFEGQTGSTAIERCRAIIDETQDGLATRALLTVPAILEGVLFAIWAIGGTLNEKLYFPSFVLLLVLLYVIAVPFSGIVNTILYLSITKELTV